MGSMEGAEGMTARKQPRKPSSCDGCGKTGVTLRRNEHKWRLCHKCFYAGAKEK